MTFFGELLFPPRCPGCDELLEIEERQRGFCSACYKKIIKIGKNSCVICGKSLKMDGKQYCKDCKNKQKFFEANKGVYAYKGPMKEAMYRFKYANRRCYGEIFIRDALKQQGAWLKSKSLDAIIPVPMFRKKQRQRGYNQAEVLARQLSKLLQVPVRADVVVRVKNSTPQKELNPMERKNNLKKAFKINKNAFKIRKNNVKLRSILLIDDIYTTGNTMNEVSSVLKTAGVEHIYCLSICIGDDK